MASLAAFLPAHVIFFLHQTSKDAMMQDAISKTILERWIGGKGQGPFTWDTLLQCL